MSGTPGAASADAYFHDLPPDRNRSARSASLMVTSSGAQLLVSVVAVAIMARILTPADFGVFTMAAFLLAVVGAFRDFGLPMATVQSAGLRHEQASALFWLNLKLCGGMAVLVAALGPVLAWFFGERSLIAITAALGMAVAVAGIANIHHGLLARRMRFGAITVTEVAAAVIGAAAGIATALGGAGYWALVAQQVGFFATLGLLPWLLCGWRPDGYLASRRQTDAAGLRSLIHYGGNLSLVKVVTQLGSNLDFVLIGRFAGAGPLGLYQAAFRWAMLPVQQLYTPLNGVVVATLSRLRDDVERYRAAFRTAVRCSAALVMPALAFLFVAAHDVVLLLLGEQWLGAVPLFQALAVAAFLDIGRLSCKWVYLAEGRMRRHLGWTLIATPVVMLGVALGMLWGARGVAVGYAAAAAVLLYPGVVYCMSGSLLRPRDFWRSIRRPAFAAVAAATALLLLVQGWAIPAMPLLARLPVHALCFALLYLAAWLAVPGGRREAGELLGLLRLLRPGRTTAPTPAVSGPKVRTQQV
jgi:O-antigen/teichoic acid export membrane protein